MGRTYFPARAAGRCMRHRFRQYTWYHTCSTFIVRFAPAVTHVSRAGNYILLKSLCLAIYPGRSSVLKTLTVVAVLLMLQGCAAMVVGTAVGVVTTVAVETVKVPFKVTGAVIDVATDDD